MSPAGPTGLPFSGSVDPRYAPVLPPPPMSMSMLYSSAPPGLLLPESFYRRPVIGFSDDSEKSSPELNDNLGAEAGRMSATSPRMLARHRQMDSAEPMTSALCQASGRTHQLSYPSLLLHTQLEALRHYQQQQQQQQQQHEMREDTAADSESHRRCSTSTASSPICEASAFRQPRRRRHTPDHITSDSDVHLVSTDNTSSVQLHSNDTRSPTRKTG